MARMKICGLQKTTLLDFPGKVAATVFLGGCNLRCPFCHNTDLLGGDAQELMTAEELLSFLRRRRGILEGVCITGGEPTLWQDELAELMRRIRDLDYQVKLDTNGCRPQVLKDLCGQGLVNYVAMDIKAGRQHYAEVCGADAGSTAEPQNGNTMNRQNGDTTASQNEGKTERQTGSTANQQTDGAEDNAANPVVSQQTDGTEDAAAPHSAFRLDAVEESAAWLMEGLVPYEFRTTAVKGLHTAADFTDIAAWIGGCERYFIQGFVDSGHILKSGFSSFRRAELEEFLAIVKETIPSAEIRGVDY